ncbi:MAG: PRC-barrel domain-containing protein [Actinomycetota bacterium]|nr:PRC-barrel domain-containing protein [Actinomycetota bacterium]
MTDTTANRRPFDTRPLRLREEGLVGAPGRCIGYAVCDPRGRKIGSVAELFFNDFDEPEYINVKMGLFGSKTVLIPVVSVFVSEEQRTLVLQ